MGLLVSSAMEMNMVYDGTNEKKNYLDIYPPLACYLELETL